MGTHRLRAPPLACAKYNGPMRVALLTSAERLAWLGRELRQDRARAPRTAAISRTW